MATSLLQVRLEDSLEENAPASLKKNLGLEGRLKMGTLSGLKLGNKEPLRVAAYCRISFDEDDFDGSYENQRKFFEKEIKEHPGWALAGIYGDYAKSGKEMKRRANFKKMMRRAEEGCIDYILVKSISRFSRSASDTLYCLRKLSKLGVGVYFMEQSLDTMSGYGDLIVTLLATIAEMESNSIAENMKVIFKGMNERGTPLLPARYGYVRKGKDWIIDPTQALRVKLAFLMAANGYAFSEIADHLNRFERVDRIDKDWTSRAVRLLLLSEVYIGDILTNKTTTIHVDGVGRKQVLNNNLEDQYYIDNHHDPLVGRSLWEKIGQMIRKRQLAGQHDFDGIEEVQKLAKRDHMLDEVRMYLPRRSGRWVALRERRLSAGEVDMKGAIK